ncbi:MAG: MCP four helix bundle domain-containing protein, partial [Candidatus Riflebacteria bacterium]|nr:MCP four helix bundle domain-containing protein [Candidatus Riflebacteria bacterium]
MGSLKLGTKIVFAFAVIIVIILGLGYTGVLKMGDVKQISSTVVDQEMPMVVMANGAYNNLSQALFEMRGYSYSYNDDFYNKSKSFLENVRKNIQECDAHSAKFSTLTKFKESVDLFKGKVDEYEKMVLQTKTDIDSLKAERVKQNDAADAFMKSAYAFLDRENKLLVEEMKSSSGDANLTKILAEEMKTASAEVNLQERLNKTVLINDAIDAGNALRIANWKSQATSDYEGLRASLEKFETDCAAKLTALRHVEKNPDLLKQLDEVEKSGLAYGASCKNMLKVFEGLAELGKTRLVAANSALKTADDSATYGVEQAKVGAKGSVDSLTEAIKIMWGGMLGALLFAFLVALFLRQNIEGIIAELMVETKNLIDAAINGKLDTRADVNKINFEFRPIVEGVNKTLDSVIGPLNVAAEYVDRISKGDIPKKITDNYKGDFNEIKNNLNNCVDAVNLLVSDTGILVKAAVEGKLDTRADATKHQGDFKKIVEGVNKTLDSVIGPLNVAAEYVDRISKGDIPKKITDNYNGDFNEIKNNLNQCIDAINALVTDANILAIAAAEGRLDTRADGAKHHGDFRKIIEGVNGTITNIVNPLNVTADYVDKVSKGVIPPIITQEYKGQYNIIKGNLNNMVKMMGDLLAQTDILIRGAAEGQLDKRANADLFVGGWNKLVVGVNEVVTNIVNPLNVTADYVEKVSKGIIPPIITQEYKGQYNVIKGNLNNMVKMMNDLLAQTDILIKGAAEGQLDKRANADLFVGGWNKLVVGVNEVVTNIVNPLNVTADYVEKVSKGIIPPIITQEYKGQYNVIKGNLNNMVKMMNDLLAQTDILIKGAADGQLDKRANADLFVGGWNKLVVGVNEVVTNIVNPLNVTADYVEKVS